jgi:hypothetical protein
MTQLSERAAETLAPEQAAALIHVLDLQARWENHRDDPAKSAAAYADLQARQKAYDLFQVARRNYAAKYRNAAIPEPTQNVPDRLAIWCRALRAVFQRSESGSPGQVLAKVYRLADRIAARMAAQPVERTPAENPLTAVRELDAVIAWCDALAPAPTLKLPDVRKEEAA